MYHTTCYYNMKWLEHFEYVVMDMKCSPELLLCVCVCLCVCATVVLLL